MTEFAVLTVPCSIPGAGLRGNQRTGLMLERQGTGCTFAFEHGGECLLGLPAFIGGMYVQYLHLLDLGGTVAPFQRSTAGQFSPRHSRTASTIAR